MVAAQRTIRQRLAVILAPDVEQRFVRDADPQHEPIGIGLAQRELAGGHRQRVAGPDVGDAGRDGQRLRRGEQELGGGEHLAADRFAGPQCRETQLLDLCSGGPDGVGAPTGRVVLVPAPPRGRRSPESRDAAMASISGDMSTAVTSAA